jgi:hypothetical protein
VKSHRGVSFVGVTEEQEVTAWVVFNGRKMPCPQHDRKSLNVFIASIARYVGVTYDTLVLSDVTQAFAGAVDKRQ